MDITLPPYFEEYVREQVASGKYGSESEVICDALRTLEQRQKLYQIKLDAARVDVERNTKDARLRETEAIFAQLSMAQKK